MQNQHSKSIEKKKTVNEPEKPIASQTERMLMTHSFDAVKTQNMKNTSKFHLSRFKRSDDKN